MWKIPGGGIEPKEDVRVAAAREVQEEAGVIGRLDRCLGIFENKNIRTKTRTTVYVLIVNQLMDDWDEARTVGRKRQWFQLDDALRQLAHDRPSHWRYLDKLKSSVT